MIKQNKVYLTKSLRDYVDGLKKIGLRLKGIEWLIATLLYLSWPLFLSFWLRVIFFRIRPPLIVEIYVIASVAVTIAVWWWMPTLPLAMLCSYFLLSTVVVLLHIVLLTKVFGDIESAERSLILFISNVIQLVFTFSIWYELEANLTKEDALFSALLVLGTLGYPYEAKVVVGVQIATDFLLLAIFLAHLVGRVGHAQDDIAGVSESDKLEK